MNNVVAALILTAIIVITISVFNSQSGYVIEPQGNWNSTNSTDGFECPECPESIECPEDTTPYAQCNNCCDEYDCPECLDCPSCDSCCEDCPDCPGCDECDSCCPSCPPEANEVNCQQYCGGEGEEPEGSINNILINEIYPAPSDNGIEWIELYNPTNSDINITHCYIDDIIDGGGQPKRLDNIIVIQSHGFWVFEKKQYFNNVGDDVNFIGIDGITVIDSFKYESTKHNESWYRLPDGEEWQEKATDSSTKGTSNT